MKIHGNTYENMHTFGGSKMKKCVIIGAGSFFGGLPEIETEDFVIAADGGYRLCAELGITPSLAVGDWDSLNGRPDCCPCADLPVEKNDTDTLAAIRIGIERGFEEFHIFGGTGGRTDHTFANMQCLVFLAKQGKIGFLHGEREIITAISDRAVCFSGNAKGDISVFAADGAAQGVFETGLKYSLDNAAVTSDFPIGVSNSFTGKDSRIEVRKGSLYIFFPVSAAGEIVF